MAYLFDPIFRSTYNQDVLTIRRPGFYDPEALDWLAACLRGDPVQRPSGTEYGNWPGLQACIFDGRK